MNSMTLRGCLVLALVGMVMTVGCDQSDNPATYKVTGKITLDGKAVEGATVSFVPIGDGEGAVGQTGADGEYSLTSFGTEEGAVPGKYMVQVSKFEYASSGGGGGSGDGEMPADYGGAVEDDTSGKNVLPAKYGVAKDSGLEAEVTEDASGNEFNFDLKSDGSAPEPAPTEGDEEEEGAEG